MEVSIVSVFFRKVPLGSKPGAELGRKRKAESPPPPPPPPPQGFDPLPTQSVPLCKILRYPYLVTDLKSSQKSPLAPKYTNFEVGAGAENTRFLVKIPKSAKKRFFGLFFQKFACGALNLVKMGFL